MNKPLKVRDGIKELIRHANISLDDSIFESVLEIHPTMSHDNTQTEPGLILDFEDDVISVVVRSLSKPGKTSSTRSANQEDKPVTFRFDEVEKMRRITLTALDACAQASNEARNDERQDTLELFLIELAEMRDLIERKIGG